MRRDGLPVRPTLPIERLHVPEFHDPAFPPPAPVRGQLRLRTLVLLRWFAIAGQMAALLAANLWLGLRLPLDYCYAAISASIIVNLIATFVFPRNRRLSETEALLTLQFDLLQLGALIFLCGGMTNPFALLLLVPVTISANALRLRSTLVLGASAVVLVTLVSFVNIPIRMADGVPLVLPMLFRIGYWLAIIVGLVFLGIYARRVGQEARAMADALLATQMALAREQKMTDLGGVVAAAAHELGTPLATIKLISSELLDELAPDTEVHDDIRVIRDQVNRCRDILHAMGRIAKDDPQLAQAPLGALLREAAEPHMARGKRVIFDLHFGTRGTASQPVVPRRPEIIHGLRNLVQNAVDFARSTVWIEAIWRPGTIVVRVQDDGAGFPLGLIDRIGDPFLRGRHLPRRDDTTPGHEGMGLGLFIAKTLLERTGARLTFANGAEAGETSTGAAPRKTGAVVEVEWRAADLLVSPTTFPPG